jgi:hypothetical protein
MYEFPKENGRREQVLTRRKKRCCGTGTAYVPGTGGDDPAYLETVEGVFLLTNEGEVMELA